MKKISVYFLIPLFCSAAQFNFEDSDSECLIPFRAQGFSVEQALNSNPAVDRRYSGRYLVGDFNTVTPDGKSCRGVDEIYPRTELISELRDKNTLKSFLRLEGASRAAEQRMGKNSYGPVSKPPIVNYNGENYCIGQRLLVCEIQGNKARLIARFIAASRKTDGVGSNGYYSPYNSIKTRFADADLPPTEFDIERDSKMGEALRNVANYYGGRGSIPLPNYLPFGPEPGYQGAGGSGLHEKTRAVGLALKDFMGSPVSLGCVRLEDYPAKFVRWYIPTGAKFFIYIQENLYRRTPPRG